MHSVACRSVVSGLTRCHSSSAEIVQNRTSASAVTRFSTMTICSRCPGEVPSSPWRLTGSGGSLVTCLGRDPSPLCRGRVHTDRLGPTGALRLSTRVTLFFGISRCSAASASRSPPTLRPQLAARPARRRRRERHGPTTPRPQRGRRRARRAGTIGDEVDLHRREVGSAVITGPATSVISESASATRLPGRTGGAVAVGQSRPAVLHRRRRRPVPRRRLAINAYGAGYLEAFPLDTTERTLAVLADGADRRLDPGHPVWRRSSVGRPAAACCARWPRRRRRRQHRLRRARHPARGGEPTPTSTASPGRSTTWPTPCRRGSSASTASRPTSATSCGRRSPP